MPRQSCGWHVIRSLRSRGVVTVSDAFLEQQLRRIRQLTERMSQLTERRELADETARDRRNTYGPLLDVRDVRIVNSVPSKSSGADSAPRRGRRRRR